MNRPDKIGINYLVAEKEVGGIPNSSEDIKQAHAAAIEMYIQIMLVYRAMDLTVAYILMKH